MFNLSISQQCYAWGFDSRTGHIRYCTSWTWYRTWSAILCAIPVHSWKTKIKYIYIYIYIYTNISLINLLFLRGTDIFLTIQDQKKNFNQKKHFRKKRLIGENCSILKGIQWMVQIGLLMHITKLTRLVWIALI